MRMKSKSKIKTKYLRQIKKVCKSHGWDAFIDVDEITIYGGNLSVISIILEDCRRDFGEVSVTLEGPRDYRGMGNEDRIKILFREWDEIFFCF